MLVTDGAQLSCLQMASSISSEWQRSGFKTNEKELPRWNTCKEKLGGLFGKSVGHLLGAKKRLATRIDLDRVLCNLHPSVARLTPK